MDEILIAALKQITNKAGMPWSDYCYLGGKPQRSSKYSVHCFGGGGQTVEAAGCCAGGGGGKGLEAALGVGSALAVCVLETDLWPPTWWTGFDTGWSTMWTGLGARVGGGFSQNEWSGCGPRVTLTVCGR